MCGIAGIIRLDQRTLDSELLKRMTGSLAHRGPDGEGYVFLAPGRKGKPIAVTGHASESLRVLPPGYTVGLGHRRLAILDRSPLGHQPMSSENERFWITYNGEVYNYLELRHELQQLGWCFRSRTDTEVILTAYQQWGTACLDRLHGMFAFAIWDAVHDQLFCARDRLGMKPFYYRRTEEFVVFGSEIKALLQDPTLGLSANERMIHDFLTLGLQDHTAETFFEGVYQLRPGHYLTIDGNRVDVGKWWDCDLSAPMALESEEHAVGVFHQVFEDAVRVHLRSDVQVGSCLSGGLDSSSIVCTVRRLLDSGSSGITDQQVGPGFKVFSSCFEDPAFDERPYQRAVVAQTHFQSIETFPDWRRLWAEMPTILWFQDEPFGGTSYLAQWHVMRVASEHGVRVLIDGQGGDELLCGYPGYWGSHLGDLLKAGAVGSFFREGWVYRRSQVKLHATVLANFARAMLPRWAVSRGRWWLKRHHEWINPEFAARFSDRSRYVAYDTRFPTALENHVAAYLQTHSLPALLHHEDRNAMAFSVEARLPFLHAPLVEFLLRLPAKLKLSNGESKTILRKSLDGILPNAVRHRTDKMGFVTPQDEWLRKLLRSELEALFTTKAFELRGYWDPIKLRSLYHDYCEGKCRVGSSVWRWVCLELWFQRFFA